LVISNKILENEILSNDGRENIHTATLNAITPESGMSQQKKADATFIASACL